MDFKKTTGIIVYLHSLRHLRALNEFGQIQFVSKKLRYVVLYVDEDKKDQIIAKLNSEKFVKEVIESHFGELLKDVTGKKVFVDQDFDDTDE